MGGHAFASILTASGESPHVPRMSLVLYNNMLTKCKAKLETIFDKVVVPRDAPDKSDYGDIDYLVEGIKLKSTFTSDIWIATKEVLGAELHVPRGSSHSYAIPHPEVSKAYVQVDVELSPGNGTPNEAELFEWTRFIKSDSDLLQIIGISHRSLGLLCNDRGLHVQVKDIMPYNKKKALLFLTRDPSRAMEFYGFDVAKYWDGFTDETDLFDWATGGRFFSPEVFEGRVEKSNDRSRQAKRPMYARFVENYVPAHADKNTSTTWTREQVLEEALATFNKQTEYEAMMEEYRTTKCEEQLWEKIRKVLPVEGNPLKVAVRGLKRWVVFENGEPHITSNPLLEGYTAWISSMSPGGTENLLSWIKDNWEKTKALEKARTSAAKAAGTAG